MSPLETLNAIYTPKGNIKRDSMLVFDEETKNKI